MATDDVVKLRSKLWNCSVKQFKEHIKTHIEEFTKFNPDSFLNINYHLISGTQVYEHKENFCQIIDAIGLCRKCEYTDTIDCTLSIRKKGDVGAAERICELANDFELFTHLDSPYAKIFVRDHFEIHAIDSKAFKEYLSYLIYQEWQKPPTADAIANARAVLSAKARFEGSNYRLYNRVAWHDEALYYDLTNSRHEVVRVTKDGWDIKDSTEIPLFKRYPQQQAAPYPERVDEPAKYIWRFLNFVNHDATNEDIRLLILVSLITSFIPDIPHAIQIVYGDQGSAKTTFLTLMRKLIDPADTDTMSFPRAKDLIQTLDHNWYCGFDNVGGLRSWLSDALCRAVTGEGNVVRKHYTDDDDFIRKYRRVVALNGINNVATQPDLLDRSLLFKLPRLQKEQLRIEKELFQEFNKEHSSLLGAIFDIISQAIKFYPDINTGLFRLADWTKWGCAITLALGIDPQRFLDAYAANRSEQTTEALVNDDVATAVVNFIQEVGFWKGKMSELLPELTAVAERSNISTKSKYWPKAPNSLSRRLNPFVTPLREAGIRLEMVEQEHRIYEIEAITEPDRPRVGTLPHFWRADDTNDDSLTVSGDYIGDTKATEKANRGTSDATDVTDDILQKNDESIPPLIKKSRWMEEFEQRWLEFLRRTKDYDANFVFALFDLEQLYKKNETAQLQRDLTDWVKDGRLFQVKTKAKEGYRITKELIK